MEEEIISKLAANKSTHMTLDEARKFLQSIDTEKDLFKRAISYFLILGIFSEGEKDFPKQLTEFYHVYENRLGETERDPFSRIEKSESSIIDKDTTRSIAWFEKVVLKDFGLKKEDALLEAGQRILSFCVMDGFNYVQGFDRYMWILFGLSIHIANAIDANMIFAEAITIPILEKFLSNANFYYFLNQNNTINYFEKFDNFLKSKNIALFNYLNNCGVISILYGLKWRLLFFADEHNPKELLLIWDNIIIHQSNDIENYFLSLSLAHLEQIDNLPQPMEDNSTIIERIQNYRNWNVPIIIERANEIFDSYYKNSNLSFIGVSILGIVIPLLSNFFGNDNNDIIGDFKDIISDFKDTEIFNIISDFRI